ncbi:MAG TPA: protein kinase [Pirellulales bacterium]|jgi:serine/threonine-protein kinase|nr:protein kinase [Pirellulales bacterium]
MAELSAEDIAQRAFGLELLDDRSFHEVRGELTQKHLNAEQFQQLLLRRGLLTPYQMERVSRGDRTGYFYGSYKVLYQVGAGTFARVYRAVHRETGKVVAVKVLRQRFTTDAKKCEQFRREAQVGLTLRHPNIVAVYEVGAEKPTQFEVGMEKAAQYIAMEFIEGQSLREFIKSRKQIDPRDAVRLMADITRGLDYAARRGISHRDMKASNVLVSSTGQAKLVDFGLAGVDPEEASDELAGGIENPRTIDYVALERVTGISNGDIRGDIFFAGCILYHMLAGVPPLEPTRDRIARSNPSRFLDIVPIKTRCPELPPYVIAVVEHALELNPKHRYQTSAEMLAELTVLQRRLNAPEGSETASAAADQPGKNRPVMIVESNARAQDLLRDQLKKNGYRVLVTSDPQRPLAWFAEGKQPAECVLFSTGQLGEQALAAFNEFGSHGITSKVPAVLLLGARHQEWLAQAKLSPLHVHISSPIKVPMLLELLEKLMEPSATAAKAS